MQKYSKNRTPRGGWPAYGESSAGLRNQLIQSNYGTAKGFRTSVNEPPHAVSIDKNHVMAR